MMLTINVVCPRVILTYWLNTILINLIEIDCCVSIMIAGTKEKDDPKGHQ